MNKEISNYISEFKSIYDGEPWYGKPLMAIISNANSKLVYKKSKKSSHSAYEITHHLYAWRDLLVKRLNGDIRTSIETGSKDDWASLPAEQTADNWNKLVKKLEQNQQELVKALSAYKDESLDKNFAESAYTLRTFLNGQMQHDIYHIGQIALALKNA
jgi:uncharacterized damage-inducible protein DinB